MAEPPKRGRLRQLLFDFMHEEFGVPRERKRDGLSFIWSVPYSHYDEDNGTWTSPTPIDLNQAATTTGNLYYTTNTVAANRWYVTGT